MRRSNVRALGATVCAGAMLAMLAGCDEGADNTAAVNETATADIADADTAADVACDRQCLIDATDSYLAAIVAHDPAAAPLADDVVFVENVTKMRPGEGLWQSAVSGPTQFALHVPDEVNQTAGFIGMMERMAPEPAPQGTSPEDAAAMAATAELTAQPVMVAIRLKFEDGRIVEAEHLLTGVREPQMANLQTLRPGLLTEIPADQRLPHDRLIDIAASYYAALDDNDGDLFPFAADCERHENGMITAGGNAAPPPASVNTSAAPPTARDCYGQIESGVFQYITTIDNRRAFAADPVTGLAMGLSHFRHPMEQTSFTVTAADGTQVTREMNTAPFDLPAAHIFKVGPEGAVHEIEAMGFSTVYNAPTGWE